MSEMSTGAWLKAVPKNSFGEGGETDAPYEAKRSAVIYGASAAVLACNYGVSAEECRRLMLDGFEHELERRRGLNMEFEP